MRRISISAVLVSSMSNSVAAHPEPPACVPPEPTPPCCSCPAQPIAPAPNPASPSAATPTLLYASLEVSIGLGNTLVGITESGGELFGTQQDVGPLLVLTPTIEWRWGRYLFGGIEWSFSSVDDAISLGTRRSVSLPMARARLTFPVYRDWSAEGVFGVGLAIWSAGADGSSLYGWSRRWAVGSAYGLGEDFAAFVSIGNVLMQASPAGKGPLSDEYSTVQPVGSSNITLGLGIRARL